MQNIDRGEQTLLCLGLSEGGGNSRYGSVFDRVSHVESYRAGAVRLRWALSVDLHFTETINKISGANHADESHTPGKLLTV